MQAHIISHIIFMEKTSWEKYDEEDTKWVEENLMVVMTPQMKTSSEEKEIISKNIVKSSTEGNG